MVYKFCAYVTAALLLNSAAALATSDMPIFDSLSQGNRKIIQALFDAQGLDGLTLEQIAEFKQDGVGFGELFKQMRADSQIPSDARNLGQLVSGRYSPPEPPLDADPAITANGDGGTNADMVDLDPPETPTFDALSRGNRKIIEALYDAQPTDLEGDPIEGSLTLEQIAQAKQDGVGFGELFKQMQADLQIPADARNLGQLVSGRYQPTSEGAEITTVEATRGHRPVVVTTAAGNQVIGGGNSQGAGKSASAPGQLKRGQVTVTTAGGGVGAGLGHGGSTSRGSSLIHVSTAAGAANAVNGGGHALGHDKAASGGGNAFGHGK